MSGVQGIRAGECEGDQFFVTHCSATDSVLNKPGYTVRAASTTDPAALKAALRYPPYELPVDLWKYQLAVTATPRRLARTTSADDVWVSHSAYLPKNSGEGDRSYFTHLFRFPAADPAVVLRSWGSDAWVTSYPAGAKKGLPGKTLLPSGSLVGDEAVTAFLGDSPGGPTEFSTTVCPQRLRGPAGPRRDLFARFALAVVRLAQDENQRLFVHAEPGLVALLLYGALRILPWSALGTLTFSTYEPYHRNIRDYKLARVVGTYIVSGDKALGADLASAGLVLDTFNSARSSPELGKPLAEALPPGLSDLIKLAARGGWALADEIQQVVTGSWDLRKWVAEAGAYASVVRKPEPIPLPPPPAQSAAPEVIELDDPATQASPAPAPAARPAFGAGAPAPASALASATPSTTSSSAPAPILPPSRPVGGMTYSAQISRTNPACLLFLVDQSKSMADPFPGTGQTKAGVVADALNRLIQNVVLRSAKADGVRDYFRVGVIGYGQGVKAGLGGSIPFNILLPVSKLGEHPLRVETRTKLIPDGVGGVLEQKVKFPVWFDAEACGQTPMCEAFAAAGLAVKGFVEEFPNAFPPIVLNLTDGMPSDGNPQLNARLLCNQGTSDGAALLFNLLITSKPVQADYFPATEEHLTDLCSKLLFRMSSVLPPKLWEAANAEGHGLKSKARGVVINADPTAIVRFLDIGTRVTPSGK